MERREFLRRAGLLAGTAVAPSLLMTARTVTTARPNVLLIMTDQQSANAMSGVMGDEFIRTPAMDSIVASGVSFRNAYTPSPLCVPARTSIFTGQYPHVTGYEVNDLKKPIDRRFRNIGTIFREAGYDTAFFGKWHMPFPLKDARSHGFDTLGANKNNGIDDQLAPLAANYLAQHAARPFFLVVSFVNPHNICEWARGDELPDGDVGSPPSEAVCPPAVSNLKPMEGEPDGMTLLRTSYQRDVKFPVGAFDEKKWRELRWAYFRMIERVDGFIGTILAALRESGVYDNTVVVFTSDHGEMQGMHGWNQKSVLDDNAAKVPFVISVPGRRTATTSDRLVNTGIDLFPTLCAAASLPIPEGLPGMDLTPTLERPAVPDPRPYIVVQNRMVQGAPVDGVTPTLSGRLVRTARYKYSAFDRGHQRECLVDLEIDPAEMVNRANDPAYAEVLREHRTYLQTWVTTNGDSFPVPS